MPTSMPVTTAEKSWMVRGLWKISSMATSVATAVNTDTAITMAAFQPN